MPDKEPNSQSEFMIEKIKERPINKKKLVFRTLITVAMAVIFGLVACFTFLALEPILNNWMNPKEELPKIYFPEESEEMTPEDMLSGNISDSIEDDPSLQDSDNLELNDEEIQQIVGRVRLTLPHYRQMYSALANYSVILQKSVVTLTGIQSHVDWLNDINESENRSSGVIIANNTQELLILTDFTPLQKAERILVTFCNGAETTAELKGVDPTTNLAVVTISLEALPKDFVNETIAIANQGSTNQSNLAGTPVIALGNPMGSTNSVGYGVITGASGQVYEVDVNYKLLQTDIIGSPKADGVLFNLYGQLVGIITNSHNIQGMENMVMAYGITDLKKRMEKLSNDQPFAHAGIYGMSISLSVHEDMGIPYGAYVRDVELDSPAMRAGIRQGDIIIGIDEKEIKDFSDYVYVMAQKSPENTVSVKILRQAQNTYKEMNLEMTLDELE